MKLSLLLSAPAGSGSRRVLGMAKFLPVKDLGKRLTLRCGCVPSELKVIDLRDTSRTGSL